MLDSGQRLFSAICQSKVCLCALIAVQPPTNISTPRMRQKIQHIAPSSALVSSSVRQSVWVLCVRKSGTERYLAASKSNLSQLCYFRQRNYSEYCCTHGMQAPLNLFRKAGAGTEDAPHTGGHCLFLCEIWTEEHFTMVTHCGETCPDPPKEIWAKTGSNVTPRIPLNEKRHATAKGIQLITFKGAGRTGHG